MRRIIAIGGEPATGKSTLVKALIRSLEIPKAFHLGTCQGLAFETSRVIILGQYPEEHPFGGTDRLSMAVQPHAQQLVNTLVKAPAYDCYALLFEGDRLFNRSFLTFCKSLVLSEVPSCLFYVLDADKGTKTLRHLSRGDKQAESWLRSRKTKVDRLKAEFDCRVLPSRVVGDLEANLAILRESLGVGG